MASESADNAPSLMTSAKAIVGSVLDMLQTRLGLLVNELLIQKQQLIQQLWTSLALLVCTVLAVLMLVALAVLFWWNQRFFVLGFFALLFSALSVFLFVRLRRDDAQGPALFEQSLAALQEDVRQLKQTAGHEPSSR